MKKYFCKIFSFFLIVLLLSMISVVIAFENDDLIKDDSIYGGNTNTINTNTIYNSNSTIVDDSTTDDLINDDSIHGGSTNTINTNTTNNSNSITINTNTNSNTTVDDSTTDNIGNDGEIYFKVEAGITVSELLKKYKEEIDGKVAQIDTWYEEDGNVAITMSEIAKLNNLKVINAKDSIKGFLEAIALDESVVVTTDMIIIFDRIDYYRDLSSLVVKPESKYDEYYNKYYNLYKDTNGFTGCVGDGGMPVKVVVLGDLTGTGDIDVTDLSKLQEHIVETETLKGAFKEAADIDNNKEVDIIDLSELQEYIVEN